MMRAMRWMLVVVLLGTLPVLARGQDEEEESDAPRTPVIGEPAPELYYRESDKEKGEPVLNKLRGRIVVLFFFRSDDSASVELLPTLNKMARELGKRGVKVIGMSPEKKEVMDKFLQAKKPEFETFWGGILHRYYNVSAFPKVYLIDTKGILVDRFHPGDNLQERVLAQMRKTPPVGADPESLKARLKEAEAALGKKQYARAYALAKDVATLAEKESSTAQSAEKLVEKTQEEARKSLAEAREAINNKDYEKACALLAEISVRMEGTTIASEAQTEISRLLGDREVKPKMRKALDNAKGLVLNDTAAEHEAAKRFQDAVAVYRETTEKYPETEAAAAAEKAIDRISKDPEVRKAIAELRASEEAERWLDIAERFARVEMYGKAREYYEQLLAKYPDSPAAAKAKERLKTLPAEEPAGQDEEEAPAADTQSSGEKG